MLCAVIFWTLFGWLADYSFPFGRALELFLSCFMGTVSLKINSLQQQLQRTDIVSQLNNTQQTQRLNKLESEAWLCRGVLERLSSGPSVNHEKIAKTLEALEYKRSEILAELEPLRPRRYRILSEIQDSARDFLASQAEKDYEQLEKIVSNLVLFVEKRQPSQIILSEVIRELNVEIAQSSERISPYRLRLAYKIDELMDLISSRLILNPSQSATDSGYQSLVNELRSRISTLSNQFDNLLKDKQENESIVEVREKEISNLTRSISNLHRAISNRDEDRSALRKNASDLKELAHRKQSQIENLQSSVDRLRSDIRDAVSANNNQQSQLSYLQNQLSQMAQEKQSLLEQTKSEDYRVQRKTSEIARLQNDKAQMELQRLEFQRQNQLLRQHYQQQQNEIANLNQKLKELSAANRALEKTSKPVNASIQLPTTRIETRAKISEAEYRKISNQSEYEFVSGYRNRRSGKWVAPYYRRKRKR